MTKTQGYEKCHPPSTGKLWGHWQRAAFYTMEMGMYKVQKLAKRWIQQERNLQTISSNDN